MSGKSLYVRPTYVAGPAEAAASSWPLMTEWMQQLRLETHQAVTEHARVEQIADKVGGKDLTRLLGHAFNLTPRVMLHPTNSMLLPLK